MILVEAFKIIGHYQLLYYVVNKVKASERTLYHDLNAGNKLFFLLK